MYQNDYKLAKYLLTLIAGISVEAFREIHSGKIRIVIEKGYISVKRASANFPFDFKVRIPEEKEITNRIQDWLRSSQSNLPNG